jgi:hypothetical protein
VKRNVTDNIKPSFFPRRKKEKRGKSKAQRLE